MMKMKMNSGSMTITDDNKTIVSQDIADQIKKGCVNLEDNNDQVNPDLIIKDELSQNSQKDK